jgi:hypothetical protein
MQSPLAGPDKCGRHTYDGVLPRPPKGSFVTLLSPPQYPAALFMIPHALTLVDQSPVCHYRKLFHSTTRMPRVRFWRGTDNNSKI